MRLRVLAIVVVAASLATVHLVHSAGTAAVSPRLTLPTPSTTKMLLEGAVHQSEFVNVPVHHDQMSAYISYPDRADKAPVVVVRSKREGMSDWTRAVAYQLSRDGFVAVVPDYAPTPDSLGREEDAVRQYVHGIPSANGTIATIDFDGPRIAARVGSSPVASFSLSDQGWSDTLAFLTGQTGNRFSPIGHMDHVAMEAMALEAAAQAAGRGQRQGGGGQPAARPGSGLTDKRDDLPSNYVMAARVVDETPRKNEWVDVPMANTKIHTWVVYPAGTEKVGTVLVLHGAQGATEWVRAVADQLAHDGFIALVPDLSSGLGPNGGNFDSFKYQDQRMAATGKLGREGTMARLKAVREYAAKMPRSNGKTGSLGFCGGGTNSFTLATDVPEHNASVVFYGGPPPLASLANIKAPVIGFYGENDVRIASTVPGTEGEMKRLGKSYEAHIYPKTTHSFLWMQDLGDNFLATEDSWPRALTFLRRHLSTPAPSTR